MGRREAYIGTRKISVGTKLTIEEYNKLLEIQKKFKEMTGVELALGVIIRQAILRYYDEIIGKEAGEIA